MAVSGALEMTLELGVLAPQFRLDVSMIGGVSWYSDDLNGWDM
jgi:hypothetical protein